MFFEISQNSQENTCARVSFLIKLQAWGLMGSDFNICYHKMFFNISGIIFDVMLFVQYIINLLSSVFLISYFLLAQTNCVVLNLSILAYTFLLILFFLRRYTNFHECLNPFRNFYGFLLCKVFEMLRFSQGGNICERMENYVTDSFYRICLLEAIINILYLVMKILYGDESLI